MNENYERSAIGNAKLVRFDLADMKIKYSVPCGTPDLPLEDMPEDERYGTFGDHISPHINSIYLAVVRGDSMTGAGLNHGDIVFVDTDAEPIDGDIVLANVNNELTIKTLRLKVKTFSQELTLVPENPRYEPIRFSDYDSVTIRGVVTGRYHTVPRGHKR